MPVLVYAETIDGTFHKPALEVVTYAADTAKKLNTDLIALVIGNTDTAQLKKLQQYGPKKIIVANGDERLKSYSVQAYTKIAEEAILKSGAGVVVLSATFNGKSLAPRLAAKIKAGLVTNVVALPETEGGFTVKKPVYSGKGFGHFRITTDKKIITIGINSHHIAESPVESQIENWSPALEDADFPVKILDTQRQKGKISLTEAEVVVSGGRGMKGPENWHMIEELAEILGAATACSKPVADVEWRPHAEHVGQTGLTISPNLYIAVGISGAIQHLAGVSSSKVIAVINKDPEAPFFKAADYGIIGDVFDVMPKLIEAAKKIKNAS